jgi:hypothetical protein
MPQVSTSMSTLQNANIGPAINAVTFILLAIAIVLVLLRFYVRIMISRNLGWDDGIILFTLVSSDICNSEAIFLVYSRHF